jgi:hypothetical protein
MRRTTSIVTENKSANEMTVSRKHYSCVNLNDTFQPNTGLKKFMSQRKSNKPTIELPKHASLLSFDEALEKVEEIYFKQDLEIDKQIIV